MAASATTLAGGLTISAGTFIAPSSTLTLNGNFNYSGGTFNSNGGTLVINGNCTATLGSSLAVNNLTIASSATGLDVEGSVLTVGGTLNLSGGSLTGGASIVAQGDVNIASAVTSIGLPLTLSGASNQTFANARALFEPNLTVAKSGGIVTFTQGFTINGTMTLQPGTYAKFGAGETFTLGGMVWKGLPNNKITLRSDFPGTRWKLAAPGNYPYAICVDVQDSDASIGPAVTAVSSTDSGNNRNWIFGQAAQVAITTPSSSITSPAWVEGTNSPDVTSLTISASQGATPNANILNPEQWYADNSGTPLGIGLSATGATNVAVTASDGPFTSTVSQDITWTPTDLAGNTDSSQSVMIRQGDSLLLTDSTSGKALWLDTGGGGTPENYGGLPGDQVPCQFNTAGTYLVTATVTLPTSPVTYALDYLNIIVVSLVELKPIDIQVGYTRVQAVADSDYRTITVARPEIFVSLWREIG